VVLVTPVHAQGVRKQAVLLKVVIRMSVSTAPLESRAEALFVSCLQPSEHPTAAQVAAAIEGSMRARGECGCAEALAAEFGDHPETAAARMRWALAVVAGDVLVPSAA